MSQDTTVDSLDAARHLAACGVPIFLARPSTHHKIGFKLPEGWERTEPDPTVVDRWRPGWALCAVMGHVVDAIDVDPRNGGDVEALREALGGQLPRVYGKATTPSGGEHYLVETLGVRKVQNVVPGVDLQAGNADGVGRGFIFLAPTTRASKADGELRSYEWEIDPDLGLLGLVAGEDSGREALLELTRKKQGATESDDDYGYDGAGYDELDEDKQKEATEYVNGMLAFWIEKFAGTEDWPEGQREDGPRERGWEALSYQFAWALAKLAACPWTDFSDADASEAFNNILPQAIAENEDCSGKWWDGIVEKAADDPVDVPPWVVRGDPGDDFARTPRAWPVIPARFNDAYLAGWMAHRGLEGDWCWAAGLGWLHWDGRRWVGQAEEDATEAVRRAVLRLSTTVMAAGDADLVKAVAALLSSSRIRAIVGLMRGVTSREAGDFDRANDMLNCGNGVVDLRTGELLPHDRELLMTKITETPYVPGTTHPDWEQCLRALEPEVMDWMQVRWGQAATGWPTPDAVLPVGVGGGSNGKSTLLAGLFTALGDHMIIVPDKLLRANPNDHPTELMTLFGARVAVIEETPEAGQLNVQRLKAVLGTSRMSARSMYKNNVQWTPTHSLFLMSNYVPQIRETDHGTWRRLALVRFNKTFPKKDSFLAAVSRGDGGRREAALAWVVAGAVRWYTVGMPDAPGQVEADTRAWRGDSDLFLSFMDEGYLQLDPERCILTNDLLFTFNRWLVTKGHSPWAASTLAQRLAGHEKFKRISKVQTRDLDGLSVHRDYVADLPQRPWVWRGMCWSPGEESADRTT